MKNKTNITLSKKRHLVILIVILSIIFAVGGYLYYSEELKTHTDDKHDELKAISDLKVEQLTQWLNERIADAKVTGHSTFFIRAIERWLQDKNSAQFKDIILKRLALIQTSYHYDDIMLVSPQGDILLSVKSNETECEQPTLTQIFYANSVLNITFTDFYFCQKHQTIHYDIIVPLINEKKVPIGDLVFRINPYEYLYPFIQSWPTPSKTSETFLVKKDGDSVLFLNELRHQKNTALKLRIPLTRTDLSLVQAVLGYKGIFDGKDHRGVEVLAYIQPVPNTEWFTVTKMDRSELFSDLHFRTTILFILILLMILVSAAGLAFIYSYRQRNIYKNLYQKEKELSESQEEFRTTLYSIGDAVITTDVNGYIKNINQVAEQLTGWKEIDAKGKMLDEVFKIINEETRKKVENPVSLVLRKGLIVGLANHTLLISKHGREFPIADSGAPIRNNDGEIIGVVLVFRDQTEERRILKELRERERKLDTIISNVPGYVYRCNNDKDWTVSYISNGCKDITGYSPEDYTSNKVKYNDVIHPDFREMVWDKVQSALERKDFYEIEYQIVNANGEIRWIWERGRGVYEGNELLYLEGFNTDITARKLAEEKINEQLTELQRWYDVTLDREDRVIELKKEVNELLKKLNQPPRYES